MSADTERRGHPRQAVDAWVEVRQATTWSSWQVLDLSWTGLRATGPLGVDMNRAVTMRLHVRGYTFDVDALPVWQLDESDVFEPHHGWRFCAISSGTKRQIKRALAAPPHLSGSPPGVPVVPSYMATWILAIAIALAGFVAAAALLL